MISELNNNNLTTEENIPKSINPHLNKILELTERREQILGELKYLKGKKKLGHFSDSDFFKQSTNLLTEERAIYKELRDLEEKHQLTEEEAKFCSKATNLKASQKRNASKWHLRQLARTLGQEFNLKKWKDISNSGILQTPQRAITHMTTQCSNMKNAIDDSTHLFTESGSYLYHHGKRAVVLSAAINATSFVAIQLLAAANKNENHHGSESSLSASAIISTNTMWNSAAAITVGSFLVSTTLIKGIAEPSLKYVKHSIPKAAKVIAKTSAVTAAGTAALMFGAPLYAAAGLAIGSSWVVSAVLD